MLHQQLMHYNIYRQEITVIEEDIIDIDAEDTQQGISAEVAMQWTSGYSESVHTLPIRSQQLKADP